MHADDVLSSLVLPEIQKTDDRVSAKNPIQIIVRCSENTIILLQHILN